MSYQTYHLCRNYLGRSVYIDCHCGTRYHGVLKHVDESKAYILPYSSESQDESSNRFFFAPALIGLTLGTIAGLALAPRPYPIYPVYPPYQYPPYSY
ncbi:hypothetical protein [Fictibacillus norfolkensis]|uniref:Uncharacterized protein n=1 Tax=Fictibacillus norfolkensis TaxID=2762233 RepID=A0ABR8SJW0_9BACL|nr:hypothetical protein [Fictibacillus norfolkensis]MBD7963773.1 hypothetical protein [Fictibacillus norfolkensis]